MRLLCHLILYMNTGEMPAENLGHVSYYLEEILIEIEFKTILLPPLGGV